MTTQQNAGSNGESAEQGDAVEVCALLEEQNRLLKIVYEAATEPAESPVSELFDFVLVNALHISEMANGVLALMNVGEPYAVVLLARSALESVFVLVAALHDRKFGPQRMAYELEEFASKLKYLLNRGAWSVARKPSPDECLREAERIRKRFGAPVPSERRERDRVAKIERVAAVAHVSPFYDDDYRLLSLAVHANQAGILNTGSGFLVRKASHVLCCTMYLTINELTRALQIKAHEATLKHHWSRIEMLLKRNDFLPPS